MPKATKNCSCPWWDNEIMHNMCPYLSFINSSSNSNSRKNSISLKDYGPNPFTANIDDAALQNTTFRTVLWTGDNLQLTLMSIAVGDDIGLEVHTNSDQFLRIEDGEGIVKMGDNKNNLNFQKQVYANDAIFVPANKWHNIINTGDKPLKLYAIYAPPVHPRDTVHKTKADAQNDD